MKKSLSLKERKFGWIFMILQNCLKILIGPMIPYKFGSSDGEFEEIK